MSPIPVLVFMRDSLELSLCIVVNYLVATDVLSTYCSVLVEVIGLCWVGCILLEATIRDP
jgi:hypothetical protein